MKTHPFIFGIHQLLKTLPCLLLLNACALFTPSDKIPKSDNYRLVPPSDWNKVDRGDADGAYEMPSGSWIAYNSSCKETEKPSLRALTRHLLIGMKNYQILKQSEKQIGKLPGLSTEIQSPKKNPNMHILFFVGLDGKCILDFSLFSKESFSPKERESFENFIATYESRP